MPLGAWSHCGGHLHVHTYTQVRGEWVWCCLQVIYGLRSCCPAGQSEGRGALIQLESVTQLYCCWNCLVFGLSLGQLEP